MTSPAVADSEQPPRPPLSESSATPEPTSEGLLHATARHELDEAVNTAARRELPADLLTAGAHRLSVMCGVNLIFLASVIVLVSTTTPRDSELWLDLFPRYFKLLLVAIGLNAGMYAIAKAKRIRPHVIIQVSLGYLVSYALVLGLFRHSSPWTESELLRQWSPVAVILVTYGALVPARPVTILMWGTAAALMDPAGLFFMRDSIPLPRADQTMLLLLTPGLGVAMAYACSSVLYKLTERIVAAREIGSYRLVEQLGVGGMGEVWRANHTMLARPAAIKLIRPTVFAGHSIEEARRLVKLFEREVQVTATLTSPHTIEVYDFGVTNDGTFYYVMELLNGLDLQTLVKKFGRQPAERALYLLRQACLSLHEAHSKKFVHRDLKPANLFACRYGGEVDHVKILDFGLVMDRRPTVEELEEKGLTGTPAVMAPEMMRFKAPVDERADIYALGCVAYWMLTGMRVFEAESRNDMLVMHAHQKPIVPSRRAKLDLPSGVDELVMDCLTKNPNKRPQTARELIERIDQLDLAKLWSRDRREGWWAKYSPRPEEPTQQLGEAPEDGEPESRSAAVDSHS